MSVLPRCLAAYFSILCLLAFSSVSMPMVARAEDAATLPLSVQALTHNTLMPVGSGTYRRFGFSVYRATLWAPDGVWDPKKAYALNLHYTRSVSKGTMIDIVTDDIRDQNVADDATLAKWRAVIAAALPDVSDGDTITGLYRPGKESELFYNGNKTASISDMKFSRAFFNVWLGETADEDLRDKLLGKEK